MNENMISSFKALAEQEKQNEKPNTFKIRAYLKVSKILKEVTFEVTSSDQVKDIPGIGAKTLLKIDEILESGKLKKLEGFSVPKETNKTELSEQKKLEGVTGIGPVKAKKLVDDGYTLEKLFDLFKHNMEELSDICTHHQILGIKYYKDLLKRIPYKEIEQVDQFLSSIVELVNTKSFEKGLYKHIICGSFRRKATDSGDIDILFYNSKKYLNKYDKNTDKEFFTKIMLALISVGFLKDHLTDPEKVTTKYMGFGRLSKKKICRRIDMRCIESESLPAAMLYFTGSGEFNKNMRTFALKKGYTINEYGIYKLKPDKTKGEKLNVETEQDIFKVLGLDYVEPQDRLSTVKFK